MRKYGVIAILALMMHPLTAMENHRDLEISPLASQYTDLCDQERECIEAIPTTENDDTSTKCSDVMLGTGGLSKVGTGTFTLSGTNTYTGPLRICAGTLQMVSQGSLCIWPSIPQG